MDIYISHGFQIFFPGICSSLIPLEQPGHGRNSVEALLSVTVGRIIGDPLLMAHPPPDADDPPIPPQAILGHVCR